jgi:translocator protein
MATMSKHPWIALFALIALCFAIAGIGSLATTRNIPTWYASLAKPSWNPPNWIFGPVWSCLYLSMAVAAWLVWRKGNAALPLALFAVQLTLNAVWSWLFFGMHSPRLGFVDIVLLWLAIAATTIVFWRRSLLAGLLFLPYWAWISFAAALNCAIWRLNG